MLPYAVDHSIGELNCQRLAPDKPPYSALAIQYGKDRLALSNGDAPQSPLYSICRVPGDGRCSFPRCHLAPQSGIQPVEHGRELIAGTRADRNCHLPGVEYDDHHLQKRNLGRRPPLRRRISSLYFQTICLGLSFARWGRRREQFHQPALFCYDGGQLILPGCEHGSQRDDYERRRR